MKRNLSSGYPNGKILTMVTAATTPRTTSRPQPVTTSYVTNLLFGLTEMCAQAGVLIEMGHDADAAKRAGPLRLLHDELNDLAVRSQGRDILDVVITQSTLEQQLRRAGDLLESIEKIIGKKDHLSLDHSTLPGIPDGIEGLLAGHSGIMQELRNRITQVAPWDHNNLILGETGTGKDLIARAIHQASGRSGKFVPINCASLTGNILLSELFGHEKGAFTGADAKKDGAFQAADKGVLFLDEVAALSPVAQRRLLRAIENKTFRRLGSSEEFPVDIKLVTATNENLEAAVEQGRFREDLYHRLNSSTVAAPPLRKHLEDIPDLCAVILSRRRDEIERRTESPVVQISQLAMEALGRYEWPGNVRQLKNVLDSALETMLRGPNRIGLKDLNIPGRLAVDADLWSERYVAFDGRIGTSAVSLGESISALGPTYKLQLKAADRLLIEQALRTNGFQMQTTADHLGVNRTTLYKKILEYRIQVPE